MQIIVRLKHRLSGFGICEFLTTTKKLSVEMLTKKVIDELLMLNIEEEYDILYKNYPISEYRINKIQDDIRDRKIGKEIEFDVIGKIERKEIINKKRNLSNKSKEETKNEDPPKKKTKDE